MSWLSYEVTSSQGRMALSKLKQVSDLDLRLLRVFVQVVDQGSFAGAQAQLNISQSVLSENIKSLEIRMGVKLCERGPGGFKVLPEGREVYRAAKRLFGAIEDFKGDLSHIAGGMAGELVIALEDDILTNPACELAEAMRDFNEMPGRKQVRFRVELMAGYQAITHVAEGKAHIAITVSRVRVPRLLRLPLFLERRHLYCAKSHPIFYQSDETTTDEEIAHFSYANRGHFEPDGFGVEGLSRTGDIGLGAQSHLVLVLSGRNIGVIPDHVAQPHIETGDLRLVMPETTLVEDEVAAVFRAKDSNIAMIRHFLESLARVHHKSIDDIVEG
ncbi:LysR family transcriptional regulator [Aquamicrobium terrae]|uniref:DNA-binding transcriptional LysR family regulator n=1 Tax=Aquamicrobium terrae TaxID=1324945 RepID=A0ABV2N0F6_9HYPH